MAVEVVARGDASGEEDADVFAVARRRLSGEAENRLAPVARKSFLVDGAERFKLGIGTDPKDAARLLVQTNQVAYFRREEDAIADEDRHPHAAVRKRRHPNDVFRRVTAAVCFSFPEGWRGRAGIPSRAITAPADRAIGRRLKFRRTEWNESGHFRCGGESGDADNQPRAKREVKFTRAMTEQTMNCDYGHARERIPRA